MFENTKTVCTPWKSKYIGCSGSTQGSYFYSPKLLSAWNIQQGKSFSCMKITEKLKYLFAKFTLPMYNILNDKGSVVTEVMQKEWRVEWKKYNKL